MAATTPAPINTTSANSTRADTTSADTTATDPTSRIGTLARIGAVAGLAAGIVNTIIVLVGQAVDVPLEVDGEPFPALGFIPPTLFGAAIGVVLAAVFARRASRPQRTFVVVTVALTVLSLVTPFTVPTDADRKSVV